MMRTKMYIGWKKNDSFDDVSTAGSSAVAQLDIRPCTWKLPHNLLLLGDRICTSV
jgi:hypothetical protein